MHKIAWCTIDTCALIRGRSYLILSEVGASSILAWILFSHVAAIATFSLFPVTVVRFQQIDDFDDLIKAYWQAMHAAQHACKPRKEGIFGA